MYVAEGFCKKIHVVYMYNSISVVIERLGNVEGLHMTLILQKFYRTQRGIYTSVTEYIM